MSIVRRRTVVRGIATLSVGGLLLGATAAVTAVAAGTGEPAASAHRSVSRPGLPEPGPGRRVVTPRKDAAARSAAGAARALATGAGSTSFAFTSAAGDYIGGGQSRSFVASEDMSVSVTGDQHRISVAVHDSDFTTWWYADLAAGEGDVLRPGVFSGAERAAFRTGRSPGLDVYGDGRGCNDVYGSFTVNQIGFDSGGALNLADISFTQRCESDQAPPLTGTVHLNQFPLSYRSVSDPGDYVGGGVTKTYLNSRSLIQVSGGASSFGFSVSGQRDWWSGRVSAPTGTAFVVGRTYETSRFGDATHAALDVGGNGRGCNSTSGTLRIQALELEDGRITHLRAEFEQHCEGFTPALRGTLRYFA